MNMYQRYAFVYEKIVELEKEKEELEQKIIDKVKSLTGPYKTQYGTFSAQKRVSWKYTEAVGLIKKELVKRQKEEQIKGMAEKEEKMWLRYLDPSKVSTEEGNNE